MMFNSVKLALPCYFGFGSYAPDKFMHQRFTNSFTRLNPPGSSYIADAIYSKEKKSGEKYKILISHCTSLCLLVTFEL